MRIYKRIGNVFRLSASRRKEEGTHALSITDTCAEEVRLLIREVLDEYPEEPIARDKGNKLRLKVVVCISQGARYSYLESHSKRCNLSPEGFIRRITDKVEQLHAIGNAYQKASSLKEAKQQLLDVIEAL